MSFSSCRSQKTFCCYVPQTSTHPDVGLLLHIFVLRAKMCKVIGGYIMCDRWTIFPGSWKVGISTVLNSCLLFNCFGKQMNDFVKKGIELIFQNG